VFTGALLPPIHHRIRVPPTVSACGEAPATRATHREVKSTSRGGYIVVGIVATLMLIPTGIAAAAVAYTGIEGTNGATTTVNPAEVTVASQQLTTEANPSTFYQS